MHDDKAYCSPTTTAVSSLDKDSQDCTNEPADSASLESTEISTHKKHPTDDLGDDEPSNNNSEDLPVFALSAEDIQAALPELAYWNDLSNPYAECHAKGGITLINHLPERHTPKAETQSEAVRVGVMSSLRATSAEQWAGKADHLTPENLQRLSPYVGAHVDSPCTAGDLIHALKCGHKITTVYPEVCAANCIGAFVRHANPKDLDRPFNCNVCINEHLNAVHAGKLACTVDVHLVDPWRAWGWKSWLKTGIGFVNSDDRPKLQIACLDLQVRGRHCGAVFDPISFEYTGRLLSQTEQLLLATEGQILSENCRSLAHSFRNTNTKMGQGNSRETFCLDVVDEVADNEASRRRPLWTKRIPVITRRGSRRK